MQTQPGAPSTQKAVPSESIELPLSRAEWELLVRLPRHITIAAGCDPGSSTLATAIAAGRESTSQVVRGVVAVIMAETDRPLSYSDRAVDAAGVTAECHIAAQIVHDRLPLGDATAYQDWLLAVAGSCGCDRDLAEGLHRALTFT